MSNYTRRDFIKTTALAGAAVSSFNILGAQSQGTGEKLKVALIGCGGRGTGALRQFTTAAKSLGYRVEIVAVADAFQDKVDEAVKKFELNTKVGHAGFKAYQIAANSNAEFVIMATPPAFRPVHVDACIEGGKNCFIEKPVAVDPVGARKVIATGEKARKKGLTIVAGTQRRYDKKHLEAKSKIENGAIGEILGGSIYWNMGTLWKYKQTEGMSNAEYMARNWLNFTEMSGDHIAEQHVHQLDVANWFIGRPPVSFVGYGGRARRDSGNQFDFFSVDIDWGNDVHIHSQCRQIAGCYNRVGTLFRGANGSVNGTKVKGKDVSFEAIKEKQQPVMIQEHVELIKSVRGQREYLNCAQPVAQATMCAIGGRIAAYTGKLVRWVDLTVRKESEFYNFTLSPHALDFEKGEVALAPEKPAIPGKEQAFTLKNG